jgi:hypothetical protein
MYTRVEALSSMIPGIYKVADNLQDPTTLTVQLLVQFDRTVMVSRFAHILCGGLKDVLIPLEMGSSKAMLVQPIIGALVTEQGYSDRLFMYYHLELLGKLHVPVPVPNCLHMMCIDPSNVLPWYEISESEVQGSCKRNAIPFIRTQFRGNAPTLMPVVPKQPGTLEPLRMG